MLIQLNSSAYWFCLFVSSWKSECTLRLRKKKISYREAHSIVDLDSIPISKRNFFFFSVILIDIRLEKTTLATEFR